MASALTGPPVLSTPDNHVLSEVEPPVSFNQSQKLSDEDVYIRYEIERTLDEIRRGHWKRVALQFPDHMLHDSVRVYQMLARGLEPRLKKQETPSVQQAAETSALDIQRLKDEPAAAETAVKLTILGDTSYGSCCVDEVAAEHVDADAVVHYGRSCLSPTARLPVVHVSTRAELNQEDVVKVITAVFPEKHAKIILTADMPCAHHVESIANVLKNINYTNVFAASIIQNPSSLLPNRTLPDSVGQDASQLSAWDLFHISEPPTALLLTMSTRVKSIQIYSTNSSAQLSTQANTALLLRRRYALVTSMTTVATWGILINTLSVKNYLHIVDHVQRQIAAAGRKSYLFVVGKLNAAKVANFADIGGWVVIGCWESSLVDSREYYKPIITPFELELVLAGDGNRVWTGAWSGNFQDVLEKAEQIKQDQPVGGADSSPRMPGAFVDGSGSEEDDGMVQDWDSEAESAPPEFDLRTGTYVSSARSMESEISRRGAQSSLTTGMESLSLAKRGNHDILAVNGIASPAAQFLAQKRTWRGLGSDFEIKYDNDEQEQGALVHEGRTGVARGYVVGESDRS